MASEEGEDACGGAAARSSALWAEPLEALIAAERGPSARAVRCARERADAIVLGADLAAASRRLVALVADACEALRSPRAVRKAVERYEKCWLPLLRKHKGKQLVPPVDVEFVGYCHCLSGDFLRDCDALAGAADKPLFPSDSEHRAALDETRRVWEDAYGEASPHCWHEPFDLDPSNLPAAVGGHGRGEEGVGGEPAARAVQNADDVGWGGNSGESSGAAEAKMPGNADRRGNVNKGHAIWPESQLSPDLLVVIESEMQFGAQLTENFENATFREVATRRYRRFLYLLCGQGDSDSNTKSGVGLGSWDDASFCPDTTASDNAATSNMLLSPLVDIGVVWRAHMMLPCTYKSDILRLQGAGDESEGIVPYINACPTWSWEAQGARGRNALMRTKDIYVRTFGEPYVTAGSAFSAPLNTIPPPTGVSQDVGMNGRRSVAAGRGKGPGGAGNVQDNIHPKNKHRALLANTSFQIVIDLVGPFEADKFVADHQSRDMWYQLMPIKEGSREETKASTVRSPRVHIGAGAGALRFRHVIMCDSDTLGFAVKVKRTARLASTVVGGFVINFRKIGLFENLFWAGDKPIAPSTPFSKAVGTMHVIVSATPEVPARTWILEAPMAPNPPRPATEGPEAVRIRKYVSAAGSDIFAEFTSLVDNNCLKVEICEPSATLHSRRTWAVAEQRRTGNAKTNLAGSAASGEAGGRRCSWEVSSSGSGCYLLHMCSERMCISGLPRFVLEGPTGTPDKKKNAKCYELHPGRLAHFSLHNEYRTIQSGAVGVGGEGWASDVVMGTSEGVADDSLVWTLVTRQGDGMYGLGEGIAVALINPVLSRAMCIEEGRRAKGEDGEGAGDIYFSTALVSAMSLSLANDENEWKIAEEALDASQSLQLQRQMQVGHKVVCEDWGWCVLESLAC